MYVSALDAKFRIDRGEDVYMYILSLRGDLEEIKLNVAPTLCGDVVLHSKYVSCPVRVFLMGKRGKPIKKTYECLEYWTYREPDILVKFFTTEESCIKAYNSELDEIASKIAQIRDKWNDIRDKRITSVIERKIG
ncbi:hypothetical protein LMH73_008730 [Vibrio splendidus]|nr:hypothetical protein [Vibrio splendidus]MCC4879448.1 hypothetical protein [Vibrio splendidus]